MNDAPPIHVPIAVAAIELVREDVSPDRAPYLTRSLQVLTGVLFVGFLANVAGFPGANPGITRTAGWMMLAASAIGFGLAGSAGRWWAKARLGRRTAWVAKSPHQWPGVWFETSRHSAIAFLIAFGIAAVVLANAGDVESQSTGSRRSRPRLAVTTTVGYMMGYEVVTIAILTVIAAFCGITGARSWIEHRRFGSSRIVASRADVQGGQVLAAVLEGSPRLARAREVRFELQEKEFKLVAGVRLIPREPGHVRATQAVASSAFRAVRGLTLVPVTLPVALDAQPPFEESRLGPHMTPLGPIWGDRDKPLVWVLSASAEVDGLLYRADFALHVVTADGARAGPQPAPVVGLRS